MLYTMKRLLDAITIFHESETYRSRRNLASGNLAAHLSSLSQDGNSKRHNTRSARTLKSKVSLWTEENYSDTSSDDREYEPTKERKRKRVAPVNLSAVVKLRKDGDEESWNGDGMKKDRRRKKRRVMTWQRGRLEGKILKVKLQLPSEKGRALLRDMVEKQGTGNLDDDDDDDENLSPGPSSSPRIQDATGREDALARSAMTRPKTFAMTGKWLNAPPMTAAEVVASRRAQEDLASDEDSEPPCGMKRRQLRNRMVSTKEKPRSRRSDGNKEPLSKILGFIESVDKPMKDSKTPFPRKSGASFDDPWILSDPESELRISTGSSGPTQEISLPNSPVCNPTQSQQFGCMKVITTNWAHPIDFNYVQESSTKMCHFCADYRYGILGCGKIEVEVIQYGESFEYTEMGGGNVERGHAPTRMCTLCALNLIHTSNCGCHKMSRMKMDMATLDYPAWMAHLTATAKARETRPRHPACSLCQHPAAYGCRAGENEVGLEGPVVAPGSSKRKCTLRLCGGCFVAMKKFDWDREQLEDDIEAKGGLVRADMEFLFWGSDLHRAWGVKETSASTAL